MAEHWVGEYVFIEGAFGIILEFFYQPRIIPGQGDWMFLIQLAPYFGGTRHLVPRSRMEFVDQLDREWMESQQ